MLNAELYEMISRGENQQLDFKFEINDSRKIARTLVAFSNSEGGKLLIGVKDNGKISGIRSEEEIHMLEGAAVLYCKPEIMISVKSWPVEGKTVLEADVPEGTRKPYYVLEENGKWTAWFRQKDQNHPANQVMLEVWKNSHSDRQLKLRFSEKERFLLSCINEFGKITLPGFCKLSNLSEHKATQMLGMLISFGIVRLEFSDGEFYYLPAEPE